MDANRHKGKMERFAAALILLVVPVNSQGSYGFVEEANAGSPCYLPLQDGTDDLSRPQRCMPPFKNVVAQKPVTVSPEKMTCGLRPGVNDKYCIQTGGYYRECDICDAFDNTKSHNATSLTDIHTDLNQTWWQSVTMREGVHTTEVNLTVHLNKAYDITYVRLKFHSPRPESFAIYKKNRRSPTEEDMYPNGGGPEDWVPWQYYSATCRDTYSVPDALSIIQPRDGTEVSEDRALCNSEYSDISPLTGGNVAFSTLEGRPSAYYFDESRELQHWVSATDIKISLRRLNTFGDEVFGDYKVLQSYYYAITHFTVGGRCQCNGHSNVCIPKSGNNGEEHMICLCKHGTDGDNCETCLPDHNDMPWRRATSENANACKPCECNGWATRCQFNEELLARTGRGGKCLECQGNRAGAQCEICKDDHFISPHKDNQGRQECLPCECDPNGSTSLQCSLDGKCPCKVGVMGDKCNQCEPNYFKFPEAQDQGCTECGCVLEGSSNNSPRCDVVSGVCDCKENVEGRRCDMCRSGHFEIDAENEFGCTPCFCFDHTADCEVARGYNKARIESDFSRGSHGWTAEEGVDQVPIRYDDITKLIAVHANAGGGQGAYFLAPNQYLGDQRKSYNQLLKFRLKIGASQSGVVPSREDIIIEGQGADRVTRITLMLTAQGNPMPSYQLQDYAFRLHESKDWSPSLRPKAFMAVLANIKSIKIRGTYVIDGMGFLDEVQLETAVSQGNGPPATWIERCRCPQGYQGQFCQFCQPGYYHENSGGPFAFCIPCNCNKHADTCDPETGKCPCENNTDGTNCELCARGFYGTATNGGSCAACPCPEGGACMEIFGDPSSPICTECPDGRTGTRCELCDDGYYGDPLGQNGEIRECQKCECNNNVDEHAIGNCDRDSGQCLRCIFDTAGWNCGKCKAGFHGDALALHQPGQEQNCQPCNCYPKGTYTNQNATYLALKCDDRTGRCDCKPNVAGIDCDRCKDGYFNIDSEQGCDPCNCDSTGSLNSTCNVYSGQCHCRPGVTGQRCDQCEPNHYDFSMEGCMPCNCDPTGSTDLQCNALTGQCPCRNKVEGRMCDRCMENTKSQDMGGVGQKICEPCDDCYNLVQDAANRHRANLEDLGKLLQQLAENPKPVGQEFEMQLKKLQVRVGVLVSDALISSENEKGGTLRDRLENLRERLQEVVNLVENADQQITVASSHGDQASANIIKAKAVIDRARESLNAARKQLESKGREALRKAQERAQKFGAGSEQMSQIASEARKLAEQQEEDANEISSIAKQAFDLSNDAYNLAFEQMDAQVKNADHIEALKTQLNLMKEKLKTVQGLSQDTLRDAEEAYDEALNIYQQVYSLDVPNVEKEKLEQNARTVKQQAETIKKNGRALIEENELLLQQTMEKRIALTKLLDLAHAQQQTVDDRLGEMDKHRAKALGAVELGNSVLVDANVTLNTLNDFQNRVNDNKEAAQKSLEDVEDIRKIIDLANQKTKTASNALDGADDESHLAFAVAKDAKEIAEQASEKATTTVAESTVTKNNAINLKKNAESLKQKLNETTKIVVLKENTAKQDAQHAKEALKEANQAQTQSQEASNKVAQAKKELEDIAAILSTVEEPEPGLIEKLDRRVTAAEEKYKNAHLEVRLAELEKAKQRQVDRRTQLTAENVMVNDEVNTIKDIIDSLPNQCPNSDRRCLEDAC